MFFWFENNRKVNIRKEAKKKEGSKKDVRKFSLSIY